MGKAEKVQVLMPSKNMSVRLYEALPDDNSPPLEDVLSLLQAMSLPDRLRTLADGKQIRAEFIQPPSDGHPYWLVDFTRLRFEHGPGRASAGQPIQGFRLQAGEGFGEETAALYHPRSKSFILQINQFGVRKGALEAYFSMIDPQTVLGYDIVPTLDPTVAAKLAHADRFSRFTLKVATGNITAAMRNQNVSLARALEVGDQFQAPEMEISLSVGHCRTSLSTNVVRGMIRTTQRLIGDGDGSAVLQASVTGRNSADPEAKNEMLDLIAPMVAIEFDDLQLGTDLRFTRQSRFHALQRAFAGWRGIIRHR